MALSIGSIRALSGSNGYFSSGNSDFDRSVKIGPQDRRPQSLITLKNHIIGQAVNISRTRRDGYDPRPDLFEESFRTGGPAAVMGRFHEFAVYHRLRIKDGFFSRRIDITGEKKGTILIGQPHSQGLIIVY